MPGAIAVLWFAWAAAPLAAQATAPLGIVVSIDSGIERGGQPTAITTPALSGTRFSGEVSRALPIPRGSLRAWSGVTVDQWWQSDVPRAIAAALNLDGNVTLSRRTVVSFSEHVSSAPLDLFGARGASAVAGAPPAVLSGSEIPQTRTVSHNAALSLTRTLDTRSRLLVSGTQAISTSDLDRVTASGVSAHLQHQAGRFSSWHGGYGVVFSSSRLAAQGLQGYQNADVGMDYARPLSFWSHTTVSLTGGGALLTQADGRRVRVDAAASLTHRLTGDWSMDVGYQRPIEYLAGVAQPLVTDSLRVSAAGLLPRRISFTATATAASGTVGVVGGSHYASYVGTAHFSRHLAPGWRLDVEFHDSWYRFDSSPGAGIPPAFARRGFRTGLVWAPTVRG